MDRRHRSGVHAREALPTLQYREASDSGTQSCHAKNESKAPLLHAAARPQRTRARFRFCRGLTWRRAVKPWYERPVRALILLLVVLGCCSAIIPFFMVMRENSAPVWNTIFDNWSNVEPVLLVLLTLLVALAGASEHRQKQSPCSQRAAHVLVHLINAVPLAILLIWWWPGLHAITDSKADYSGLSEGLGYVSAICCKIDMGMCLLPIARQSLWLNAAAVGFPEGIDFHRVTGWWCIAQVLLHSIGELWAVMAEAYSEEDGAEVAGQYNSTRWHAALAVIPVFVFPWTERLDDETGVAELNSEGLTNFLGLVGAVASIVLAVFALPPLRRAIYHIFYLVHVPSAAVFIVMGAFHNFGIQLYCVPGLVSYFLDRTDFLGTTAASKYRRARADVRVMTGEWLRLDVTSIGGGDCPEPLCSEGAAGTQWMYLRVPALGREWHPFSLASHSPSVVIKAAGDWTTRLHALVSDSAACASRGNVDIDTSQGCCLTDVTTQLEVEVEGVYGLVSPPWAGYSHLLLIGGGVGITPWLPLMMDPHDQDTPQSSARHSCGPHRGSHSHDAAIETRWQKKRLLWIARDETEFAAMAPYLPSSTLTASTKVFLTRARAPTSTASKPSLSTARDGYSSGDGRPASSETAETPQERNNVMYNHNLRRRVRRVGTRPVQFALACSASVLLSYAAYYYIVVMPEEAEEEGGNAGGYGYGSGSSDLTAHELRSHHMRRRRLGESGGPPPTLSRYLMVQRILPVVCSLAGIAASAMFARWATSLGIKCPFGSSTPAAAVVSPDALIATPGSSAETSDAPPQQAQSTAGFSPAKAAFDVSYGRPDLHGIVSAAAAEASVRAESSTGQDTDVHARVTSLFVCVCGPPGMVKACRKAVAEVRRSSKTALNGGKLPIGFHAEAPQW